MRGSVKKIQTLKIRATLIYNARLSCSTKCPTLYRRKPGTKISYHRWSRYRSCGSELPTTRKPWYIFSPDFVQIAAFLASNASARHCLFLESLENRVCRTVRNMATGERVCINPCEQLWCVTVFAFWHSKLISSLFIVFERNTEEIVKK